jgi:outer membrane protein OmpA-like peptidoglycan-associated protein
VVSEGLENFNAQIPLGIGLDFRIAPSSFINLQGEYRVSLAEKRNNIQFGFGFSHYLDKGDSYDDKIGEDTEEMKGKDSDGDGITDDLDLCPQIAGLQAFAGCPDSDGDGIEDSRDQCPKLAGLRALNGCPDSDGDGVSDNDDECPNLAGLAGNNGCPGEDSDQDGVPDDKDECPNLPGSISTLGCPDSDGDGVIDKRDLCPNNPGPTPRGCPDTDGDGLDDGEDRCPNQVGSVENKGCPELNVQEQELLRIAMRDVKFDHSKATLRSESFGILNQIYDLMEKYPGYTLKVGGHTDNTGSLTINQRLSGQRAKACYDYLLNKGIPSSRISYAGYGPDRPIADNSTQQGRALNRRVEFELIIE